MSTDLSEFFTYGLSSSSGWGIGCGLFHQCHALVKESLKGAGHSKRIAKGDRSELGVPIVHLIHYHEHLT